jgi:alkyl hydroperoxide reductase subunit AhpC
MLKDAKFPMASDPTGEISRLFGVYLEDEGLALRGTFVINPEGTLMNSEVNFLNLGRNIDDLVRRLRANIYLAANPVQACPAQWNKPGDTTLTPSASMVGHVAEAMESKPKGKKK